MEVVVTLCCLGNNGKEGMSVILTRDGISFFLDIFVPQLVEFTGTETARDTAPIIVTYL